MVPKRSLHLSINQLLEIVEGTLPRPTPPTETTEMPASAAETPRPSTVETDTWKWKRANDHALAFMIHHIEARAESIILMECGANAAWERLREQYEGKTRTHLTALLYPAITLLFDNRTGTIDEHVRREIQAAGKAEAGWNGGSQLQEARLKVLPTS
jgi:hypothetical protein